MATVVIKPRSRYDIAMPSLTGSLCERGELEGGGFFMIMANPRRMRLNCGRGHELTPDNIYKSPSGNRQCRQCKLAGNRAWAAGRSMDAPFTHCRQGHLLTAETTYVLVSGGRSCAICQKERLKRRYYENGGAPWRHGLTIEQHRSLLESQHHACAVCQRPFGKDRPSVVDHDHRTGEVRGLLCNGCNTSLGVLGDDPLVLIRALEYLRGRSRS